MARGHRNTVSRVAGQPWGTGTGTEIIANTGCRQSLQGIEARWLWRNSVRGNEKRRRRIGTGRFEYLKRGGRVPKCQKLRGAKSHSEPQLEALQWKRLERQQSSTRTNIGKLILLFLLSFFLSFPSFLNPCSSVLLAAVFENTSRAFGELLKESCVNR